jgi:multiple sugar transport system permease protein
VLNGPVDSTLTIMSYIYERAFTGFEMGYAAALSAFLIVAILLVTVLQLRLQRRWVSYDL